MQGIYRFFVNLFLIFTLAQLKETGKEDNKGEA